MNPSGEKRAGPNPSLNPPDDVLEFVHRARQAGEIVPIHHLAILVAAVDVGCKIRNSSGVIVGIMVEGGDQVAEFDPKIALRE